MNVRFNNNGIVEIDDARIIFRNLAGKGNDYNRAGDRNFALVIPTEELANEFAERGWNVRERASKVPDGDPLRYITIKVRFDAHGPAVYLQSGRNRQKLTEDEVGRIDILDITSVDLDIRPYDWDRNGRSGRSAYLQNMLVVQRVDRFAQRFLDEGEYED